LLVQFQLVLVQRLLLVFVFDEHEQVQYQANGHVIDHTYDVVLLRPIIEKKNFS
jgi:hypothetical protein